MTMAACLSHDPYGFHQCLHIEHDIILLSADGLAKIPTLGTHLRLPPTIAPTPMHHRGHTINMSMQLCDICQRLFDDPVYLGLGQVRSDIADRGQHMD